MTQACLNWGGVGHSIRRYYLDEFQMRYVPRLRAGSAVLDLGGNKIRKRGQFNIEHYDVRVVYVNLVTTKRPDVQADAGSLPFRDGCFDAAICAELLDLVADPLKVIRETHRVLRAGGHLLICVPFLNPICSDPHAYGRYTDQYWQEQLPAAGFHVAVLEKQGLYWSTMMDMVRGYVAEGLSGGSIVQRGIHRLLRPLVSLGKVTAVRWDAHPQVRAHPYLSAFTTGFGIVAVKT